MTETKRDAGGDKSRPAAEDIDKFLIDEKAETPPAQAPTNPPSQMAGAAPMGAPMSAPMGMGGMPMGAAPTDEELKAAIPDEPPAPTVAEGGTAVPGSRLSKERLEQLTRHIIAALKTVYDPEIPTDIYELGLIYKIDITDDYDVNIDMTLTAPGCPVAGEMPVWVEKAVSAVPGIEEVFVNLTFDPPWDMSMMSEEARVALNVF